MPPRPRPRAASRHARAVAALLAAVTARYAGAAPGDLTALPAPVLGADPPRARELAAGDASVATETGAFTYAYPIAAPPGRLGMQPRLALAYSSQAPIYGGVAAGWSLDVPEIRRDLSHSLLAQDYFDAPFFDPQSWRRERFVSSLAGDRPLVEVSEPTGVPGDARATFRAQNDSGFGRYQRMAEGAPYRWRVLESSGVTHYFGDSALAPAASDKWAPLTRSVDAHGNTVEYQWEDTRLVQVRYTSNPGAGLPAFARLDLTWAAAPSCSAWNTVNEQQDARLGLSRGGKRLITIRAIAHAPGQPGAIQHTRQVNLSYDAGAASCTGQHGPLNLLTAIQESAWGDTEPRVDLPAVTFAYNRLARTFDQPSTFPVTQLGFEMEGVSTDERDNLGWGVRHNGPLWPAVHAMMLDFDGDGLPDRLRSLAPTDGECRFTWQKNLGRNPTTGALSFAPATDAIQLPRLPWASGAGPSGNEWCSLSSQFTMVTTDLGPPAPGDACPNNTGSYLAYRWLDLDSDGLPDLVAVAHHDPNHLDPGALPDLPWSWSSCQGDDTGILPEAACVADSVETCPGAKSGPSALCGFDDASLSSCLADATPVPGNALERIRGQESFDLNCFEGCVRDCLGGSQTIGSPECNDACTNTCTNTNTIDPDVPPGASGPACDHKVPYTVSPCDQYPWVVYWNRGGKLATTAEVIDQPLQLESDDGDSAFGGRGMASTQRGVDDLDGDGHLDTFVLGRGVDGGGNVVAWWEVFRGDGSGALRGVPGTSQPYFWLAPPAAPVGLSCTGAPGQVCTGLVFGTPQLDHLDTRQLASVGDLTGDGVADLLWKHGPNQFVNNYRWDAVRDSDPIELYPGDGTNFQVGGTLQTPAGRALHVQSPYVEHVNRSSIDVTTWRGTFAAEATRTSRARLLDHDGDGRLDLLSSHAYGGTVWGAVELLTNVGGAFIKADALGAIAPALAQETVAYESGAAPGPYRWAQVKDLADLDGDGLPESYAFAPGTVTAIRDTDDQPLRLLRRIDNGRGGAIDVRYAATTDRDTVVQAAHLRKATPQPQWVVASMTVSDAWDAGDTATTSYQYEYPVWNQDDGGRWGFRGFEGVTKTAPSGARTVETFGYDVDWSGRRTSTTVYPAETPTQPVTIAETEWTRRTLFGGAIETFHPLIERGWTCASGDTKAACQAAEHGRTTTWTTWTDPGHQLWAAEEVRRMAGPTYGDGGRRARETYALDASAGTYRLRTVAHDEYLAHSSDPAADELTNRTTSEYDALGALVKQSQFFAADLAVRADTTFVRDPAGSGVVIAERRPRHQPAGPQRLYSHDPTLRFVVRTTNEVGHVIDADVEPGTGATLRREGPNRVACGAGCQNAEQTWTDVDGLGRPIATYVNRAVPNQAAWVKTLTGTTTYQDGIVGGAAPRVTARSLLEYDTTRFTQEVTVLDGQGRPVRVATRTGATAPDAVTLNDYDARGNLASVTLPDPSAPAGSSATVTYTYGHDSLGRGIWSRRPVVSGAASGVDVSYDGLTERHDEVAGGQGGPAGSKILVRDAFGRMVEVRERIGGPGTAYAITTYAHDPRDRVARIASADGVVTQLTHDFAGRRTRVERAGRVWTLGYDLHGNVVSKAAPAPSPLQAAEYTTSYAYDAIDRVVSRAVGGRELSGPDRALLGVGAIGFTYDTCTNGIGRLCRTELPGNHLTSTFTYDAEGNQDSETRAFDFGGVTGTRTAAVKFGPGSRIVERTYPDNAVGSTARTRARFGLDDRGLPLTVDWLTPRTSPVDAPRPVAVQVRNVAGHVVSRAANLAGTPGTINWKHVLATWTYDRLARVSSQIVSEGATVHARQDLTYRGLDDPWTLHHVMGTTAYDFTYDHDARHLLTAVAESGNRFAATYGFTLGGRLARATVNASALPGGNVVNRAVDYAYGSPIDPEAPSALVPVGGGPELRSYSYDSAGNLRDRRNGPPTANPTDVFLYDGDDRLRRATSYSGTTVLGRDDYYYEPSGQRAAVVTRTAAGAVSSVRMFFGDAELELTPSSTVQRAYAYLSLGTPVARIESPVGGWQTTSPTTGTATIELTYHGLAQNAILSLSPIGGVKAAFVYGPYGEIVQAAGSASGQTATRRRMNDKFVDDRTALAYYGARYHDNVMLGWTQADPLYRFLPELAQAEPRRGNLYAFSLGNPMSYLDPDGRDAVKQDPEDGELPGSFDPMRGPKRPWDDLGELNEKEPAKKGGGVKWWLFKTAAPYVLKKSFYAGTLIGGELHPWGFIGWLNEGFSESDDRAQIAEAILELNPEVQAMIMEEYDRLVAESGGSTDWDLTTEASRMIFYHMGKAIREEGSGLTQFDSRVEEFSMMHGAFTHRYRYAADGGFKSVVPGSVGDHALQRARVIIQDGLSWRPKPFPRTSSPAD